MKLRRNTGYLKRVVNVAAAGTVKLGFWSKVKSFESTDRAYVKVSKNGTTFSTMLQFSPVQSDNKYHYYEIDLSSFLPATQLHIAFDAEMNATNDEWYLDDIRITGTE